MRKSKLTRSLAALTVAALAAGPASFPPAGAWAQAPAAPEVPVFGSSTAAVVVDVVVRDKKGKLVRDLTAADFTILEDGAAQAVESLRVVDTAPAAEEAGAVPVSAPPAPPASRTAAAPPPAKVERTGAPSIIAFVFDRLSVNARKTAEKAALSYADRGYVEGDLVAVFTIDLALHTLQPFTNDVKAVKAALSRAATQGNTGFSSERAEARERTAAVAPCRRHARRHERRPREPERGLPGRGPAGLRPGPGQHDPHLRRPRARPAGLRDHERPPRRRERPQGHSRPQDGGLLLRGSGHPGQRAGAVPLRHLVRQPGQRERVRDRRGRAAHRPAATARPGTSSVRPRCAGPSRRQEATRAARTR